MELVQGIERKYELVETAQTTDCGLNPAWLLLAQEKDVVCVNEAYTMLNSGSVATFTKDLKILSNITTIPGPSEGVIVRTEWFFRMWPVLLIQ